MVVKWNGGGFDRPQSYPEGTMPYLVLKSCVYSGGVLNAGDIVEISNKEAASLVSIGRIQPHDGPIVVAEEVNRMAAPKSKRSK
jgi:hypothetical protein